jgi:uracil-DNA glycosylase
MTMTREDVLNELELLPVWHLREALKVDAPHSLATPPAKTLEVNNNDTVTNALTPATQEINDSVYEKPLSIHEAQAPLATPARFVSKLEPLQSLVDYFEVGDYVFIVAHTPRTAEVNTLLTNMLRAMRLTLPTAQTMEINNLPQYSPKVTVAMGEMVATMLFDAELTFETLRGQVHQIAGQSLVVSYDAEYLLAHPDYKANAWADLCLAMQAVKQNESSN